MSKRFIPIVSLCQEKYYGNNFVLKHVCISNKFYIVLSYGLDKIVHYQMDMKTIA